MFSRISSSKITIEYHFRARICSRILASSHLVPSLPFRQIIYARWQPVLIDSYENGLLFGYPHGTCSFLLTSVPISCSCHVTSRASHYYICLPHSLALPSFQAFLLPNSSIAFLTASTAFPCTPLPAATTPSFALNVLPFEKSKGAPCISLTIPPDSAMRSEPEAWSQIFSW